MHEAADRFLRGYDGSGTQRTYAYLLLDHLRWLEREGLALETVSLQDLKRYMAALGAGWRGRRRAVAGRAAPVRQGALSAAAACVKGFYLHQALLGVNPELGGSWSGPGCRRGLTGSGRSWDMCRRDARQSAGASRQQRRHPKMPPDGRPGEAAGSGDHAPGTGWW